MNTSTRRLHTSRFACLAHRGGGFSEEVEGSGMTSALLRWEAGVGSVGAGRHWRQACGCSRAVASEDGGPFAGTVPCPGMKRTHFLPLSARFGADFRRCQGTPYPRNKHTWKDFS